MLKISFIVQKCKKYLKLFKHEEFLFRARGPLAMFHAKN